MAKQLIDRGTVGDPQTGDSLYEGADKINSNATELYDKDTAQDVVIALNTAKTSFPGFTNLLTDYSFTDNSANWNTAYGWGNNSISGGVVFGDGTDLIQDTSNLFWDNINKRLGLGTNTPNNMQEIVGTTDTAITNVNDGNIKLIEYLGTHFGRGGLGAMY